MRQHRSAILSQAYRRVQAVGELSSSRLGAARKVFGVGVLGAILRGQAFAHQPLRQPQRVRRLPGFMTQRTSDHGARLHVQKGSVYASARTLQPPGRQQVSQTADWSLRRQAHSGLQCETGASISP